MNGGSGNRDIVDDVGNEMERAEDEDDQSRLETLEKVQKNLESELDEGAEAPPAGR